MKDLCCIIVVAAASALALMGTFFLIHFHLKSSSSTLPRGRNGTQPMDYEIQTSNIARPDMEETLQDNELKGKHEGSQMAGNGSRGRPRLGMADVSPLNPNCERGCYLTASGKCRCGASLIPDY